MSEWKEFFIEELADFHNSTRVPLSAMQRSDKKGIYPYYGASGIVDYIDSYLFDGSFILISEDGENLKTRNTPIAFEATGKFWVNNHAHILKAKKEYLTKLLILYFAQLDLNPYLTGAVQPKLNKASLSRIPIYLPESEQEQKAIADVLSALDDKIDLLQRQNETLEKMAETLFRQWFIEEAKEDWKIYKVSDIADHIKTNIKPNLLGTKIFKHYSLPAFDNGKTALMELGSSILSNKYIVANHSILVSKLNPRVSRVWLILDSTENDICSTEFQNLCPKNNQYLGFLYSLFKSNDVVDHLSMSASGTSGSHQRVRPEDMLNIEFSIPNKEYMIEYSNLIKPFLKKQHQNLQTSQTLQNLRDTLLPKLMSGEVRVKLD